MEGKERSRDPAENASGMEEDTLEKMQWKPKDSERMTDTGMDHGDSTLPPPPWISPKNEEMKRRQRIAGEIQGFLFHGHREGPRMF